MIISRLPLVHSLARSSAMCQAMLQLPVQTSMHGDQIGPSPRAYHMWFYISKQIDSRISASRDLTELMELHRAAGRFSHINHASLLMKVASLRREATTLPLTTASGTILDHPTLSSTNIQTGTASTPDSATQVASPSTPALEDGNTSYPAIPAQLKQQSASASLSSPSLSSSSGSGRVFSTIAPLAPRASISSSSPSSTPSDAQDVEIRKVPLFLGRICHKVQKMSKWFEPKHAALIVTSLSHLTHPASPSSLSSDGNLSSSWPSTWGVDRQLSLTVIDHVLLKASKRVRDESFTKDLAFVASGLMKLGHASVPEWWEETFKSIALKLPTGKVPLHNISRILTSASRLGIAIPSPLMHDISTIVRGHSEEDADDAKRIMKVIEKSSSMIRG